MKVNLVGWADNRTEVLDTSDREKYPHLYLEVVLDDHRILKIFDRAEAEGAVEIYTSSGTLAIEPRTANVVWIRVKD